MNKAYKYTVLTFLITFAFVIVSMVGMKFILQEREKQLLTESGEMVMEAPVRAWQEWEDQEDKNSSGEKYSLTAKQVKDAMESWDNRKGVTLHNSIEGQISMEKAIEAGEEWLAEMEAEENAQEIDMGMNFVRATLGVGEQKRDSGIPLEPYYSFWTVQFSSQDIEAVLYINAVTGRVWSAELTLFEKFPEEMPYEKLHMFVEMTGLKQSNSTVEIDEEKKQAVLTMEDGLLYAQMDYSSIVIGENTMVEYINREIVHERYVVITYEIMADLR